jgi:hypothetical protein
MSLRIRRGTEQERIGRTFDQGEIIWTTNGEKLYVGDGVTPGGKNIAAQLAGTNLAFNATTGTLGVTGLTTDLVTEGLNNKYFSAEAAQDAIGAAIAAGSQSGISVVYNDNGAGPASINFTVTGGGGGGLSDIVLDTSPSLGGNLDLNGKNIFGTGSIDIDGNFEVTGSITGDTLILNNGLGSDLILNGNDISGTGDVRIAGNFTGTNVSVTGTISATNGLGANLNLNSRDITGFGGINIVGDVGAVNITADTITATGTLSGETLTGNLNISVNPLKGASDTEVMASASDLLTVGNATLSEVRLLTPMQTIQSQTTRTVLNLHASIGATPGSPYTADTDISYLNFKAWSTQDTDYKAVSNATISVDSNIGGTNDLPGRIVFSVGGQNNNLPQYIALNSYGYLAGPRGLTLTALTNATTTAFAAGAAYLPAASVNGTIIYNSDAGSIQAYINGAFRNFVSYASAAPSSSKGAAGDLKGMVFATSGYVYTCYADYTSGTPDIWARTATTSATW